MADLSVLTEHLGAMLGQLDSAERRKLATDIGRELRKRNQRRITQQKNPDGSAYIPRARKVRDKKGRIKTKMFMRLKTAKFLKIDNNADRIAIGFAGRVANIARVHHFGLRDRPSKKQKQMRYEKRELLGFENNDLSWIEDRVLQHVQSGL